MDSGYFKDMASNIGVMVVVALVGAFAGGVAFMSLWSWAWPLLRSMIHQATAP